MARWGIALAVWLMVPGTASAEQCESMFGGPAITPAEVAERYAYIETTLRTERRKGRIWTHAWGWGLLAAAGAQVGAVYVDDIEGVNDCHPCLWVGAGKSLLGVGATFITNPVRVETVDKNTAPTCADLADAEEKLEKAAKSERIHWMRRVEGYGVNTAALLYLGFGEDEWLDGTIGFAVGVIVGELRLYTRPDGAVSGLRRYKLGAIDAREGGSRFAWTAAPLLTDEGYGLSLLGVF